MKQKNAFVSALLKEIRLQPGYLPNELIETIYFGGGTPSLLEGEELDMILSEIRLSFPLSASAEITLEANPDDVTEIKAESWLQSGINRISLGVQSFHNMDLEWMNRAHSSEQAFQAIRQLQNAGISNITIDLIYGTPTLTDELWKKNVETAILLNIPHLSCYALTVEPKTALDSLIKKKIMPEVNQEDQARQFSLLMQWMEEAGYEHYEISNFAKPGARSRHNSSYWHGSKYLGLGPSAHSFNGKERQWNIANNSLYITSLEKDIVPFEKEVLTETQRLNEYVMTSGRTMEGIDLSVIERDFGKNEAEQIVKRAGTFLHQNKIVLHDHRLILTKEGKLFADGIAAGLFK